VIASIALKKAEATGYVDETAGDNLYGQLVTFNRNGCKWGWRRRVQVESERIPSSDQTRIVYSLRVALGIFSPTGAVSGIESVDEVLLHQPVTFGWGSANSRSLYPGPEEGNMHITNELGRWQMVGLTFAQDAVAARRRR